MTPWGPLQTEREIVPGISSVVAAHGNGIHLDALHFAAMPEYLRIVGQSEEGWYRDRFDLGDAAIPICVFEGEIREFCNDDKLIEALDDGLHLSAFARFFPDLYRRYFGVEEASGGGSK